MGLIRDVGGAAIGAAFPGAGAAVAGGGKKRATSFDPSRDDESSDSGSSSDAGSDGGYGSYIKRFGQNLGRSFSQPKRK